MSDSESAEKRADRLQSEALDDTDIDEGRTSYKWSAYFGGRVEVYWQRRSDGPGFDLILDSTDENGGRIRSVVDLECLSENIASLFPDDYEAAMAWEDVFLYLIDSLDALPYLNMSLTRRSLGLRPRGKETEEEKMFYAQNIEPLSESLEKRRLAVAKQLRGEWRRGGSAPRVPVGIEQCVLLAAEYPLLLAHWRKIKKWRKTLPNWRDHANLDLKETPDDLLDRLDDKGPQQSNEDYPGIPAVLALEHAARRCGIPKNTYSYSTLKLLRRRGEETGQVKKND
jgi:hypothetical protein